MFNAHRFNHHINSEGKWWVQALSSKHITPSVPKREVKRDRVKRDKHAEILRLSSLHCQQERESSEHGQRYAGSGSSRYRKRCTGKAQSADIQPARLPQRCHRIGLNGLADGQPLAARLIPRRALTCVERRAVGRLNESPPESRTAACDNRDDARHRATTVASIDVASAGVGGESKDQARFQITHAWN